MNRLNATEWEVLNATADDWENLEQICSLLRAGGPGKPLPLEAVADGIRNLVESGLLAARLPDADGLLTDFRDLSYVWRAWFQMTPAGREAWSQLAPAYTPDQP
jgi:hypothetical protein